MSFKHVAPILTCYALIFCLFTLVDLGFLTYFHFSSDRLLPSTCWLLPRVVFLHIICLFIWLVGTFFECLRVPFQYHSRLFAYYTQTSFHFLMKWTTIIASFSMRRYLYIYILVPLCWSIANWTCIIARLESKIHPQSGHRSFLIRVSKPMRWFFVFLAITASVKHFLYE